MRILIINYFYPPVIDAHAYRWEQIARLWVLQGDQVDVISGRLNDVPDRVVQAGVNVTRVGLQARPIMHSPLPHQQPSGVRARLQSTLANALRPVYRKLYWPDAWWHWWPSAVRAALGKRHVRYDLVVSYYPCFGAHLAAAALHRRTKSSGLRWIADYGDPFSTSFTMPPNNFQLYGRLNRMAERHIAQLADVVVVTNEATAAAYEETGVCPQDKVRVLPHLVDVDRVYAGQKGEPNAGLRGAQARRVINLLYIGGFHRGIREPYLLFDIVRQLNKNTDHEYLLTIHGPANGFDLSPSDCPQVHYKGMIEREKALDLIREADVLVNVDNENCVMAPSKIVDYIGTGRPLLNLKGSGLSLAVVARYVDSGFALELSRDDPLNQSAGQAERFLSRTAGTVAPRETVESVLDGHTLSGVANRYRALASGCREQANVN